MHHRNVKIVVKKLCVRNCEHGIGLSGSIEDMEFLEQLSYYRNLTEDNASLS
jgi:hypothetical protein